MSNKEEILKRLESSILEAFPEASARDALILSGFVALFCTAQEEIKVFLTAVIQEGLADAQKINKAAMEEIKNKMEKLKSNKKQILN